MNGLTALLIVAVAGLSFVLTRWLAGGGGIVVLDHPNERSLHDRPIPRTGGLAIVAAIVLGHLMALLLGWATAALVPIVAATSFVFAVSVVDDLRTVPALLRLLVHLLAAAALVAFGVTVTHLTVPGTQIALAPWLAAVLVTLFVTWMTNLFNFMDGMDGFAGGMGCIGFACYALLGALGGDAGFALTSALIAAACAGFLVENFAPARIFMGDAGSSVLGFVIGALTVYAERSGLFPVWLGVVVFSPFIVDASVTLVRRALAAEAVWRAHRSHHYQRLVRLGWSHRRTALWGYLLMLLCAVLALVITDASAAVQWLGLLCLAAIYAMLMLFVHRLERAGNRA